ncbi:hypothetical protein PHISP_01710 [Aspergillus sp. HF37]|nr:hypothetical protein PHISP_01710 [Aspergillus sp. HF37]
MFVFRGEDLPADPAFPADLEQLGYFINENDQIRKISDPDQEFQFKINRNPRWNEVQRNAMNDKLISPECIRTIVSTRLQNLGLTPLHLPLTSGPTEPRVPILVSRNLSSASRIVVIFGEPPRTSASGRIALSARTGSMPGQLIWHCAARRCVTHPTWLALPRRSAVDPPVSMSARNEVPRNATWQDHVECVFEDVLAARGRLVRGDARIAVIGLAEGGLGAVRYLGEKWPSWRPHINALCFASPLHFTHVDLVDSDPDDPASFAAFVASRCRAYVLAPDPLGVPAQCSGEHGCNCYSSGEALNNECIMPRAWRGMLEWLDSVHADPGFCEPRVVIRDVDVEVEVIGDEDEAEG